MWKSICCSIVLLGVAPALPAAPGQEKFAPPTYAWDFGSTIAASDALVIASPHGQLPDSATRLGYVEIHTHTPDKWTLQTRLVAPEDTAQFGAQAALDGDWLALAAQRSSPATGAIFVFHAVGGAWSFVQRIDPPGAPSSASAEVNHLALHGGHLVAEVDHYDSKGKNLGGQVFDFELAGAAFGYAGEIVLPLGGADRNSVIAFAGERLAIGAPSVGAVAGSGVVYTFTYQAGSWLDMGYLTADSVDDNLYGAALTGCMGSLLAVGARPPNALSSAKGYVELYAPTADGWTAVQSAISPPSVAAGADFPAGIACGSTQLVAVSAGANQVYSFRSDAGVWRQGPTYAADAAEHGLGSAIAARFDDIIVGDPNPQPGAPTTGRAFGILIDNVFNAGFE